MPEISDWSRLVYAAFDAGHLTRDWRDVLLALRSFRGYGGGIYPSHESLAVRATASVSTVKRALKAGAELALVSWQQRTVRIGWRRVRTSNAYQLHSAALPPPPATRGPYVRQLRAGSVRAIFAQLGATNGQSERGTPKEEKEGALKGRIFGRAAPQPPVRTVAEQLALLRAS
jgi:hypothetical protein